MKFKFKPGDIVKCIYERYHFNDIGVIVNFGFSNRPTHQAYKVKFKTGTTLLDKDWLEHITKCPKYLRDNNETIY